MSWDRFTSHDGSRINWQTFTQTKHIVFTLNIICWSTFSMFWTNKRIFFFFTYFLCIQFNSNEWNKTRNQIFSALVEPFFLLPIEVTYFLRSFSSRWCHRIIRKRKRVIDECKFLPCVLFAWLWRLEWVFPSIACVVEKSLKFRCRTKPLSLPKKNEFIYQKQCLIRHFLVWRNIYVLIVHKRMFKICGKPLVQLLCPHLLLPI